jgi:hypothetical protein
MARWYDEAANKAAILACIEAVWHDQAHANRTTSLPLNWSNDVEVGASDPGLL